MKFFKECVTEQKADVNTSRRFSLIQYIVAIGALLLSVTAISYAAGILTLNVFKDHDVISSKSVNDNFDYVQANLNIIAASMVSMQATIATLSGTPPTPAVPAGTLVAYAGTTVPVGYKQCPTNFTDAIVSTADYPALFAAVGSTWGTTGLSTSFIMPWFPEGYTLLQGNVTTPNVGAQSVGEVITHTHRPVYGGTPSTGTGIVTNNINQSFGAGVSSYGTQVLTIEATGGPANLAAGTKIMMIVKI